jgi:1-acyl-sn-glycerol-3-phosphate acyltransferase
MKPHALVPLFFQKLIWIPTRFCLEFFADLKVEGLNNLKDIQGPVIFACNHSNDIDPFMVPASLPFFSKFSPLFYAVREKEFYEGKGLKQELFNEWFISLWGGYPARVGLKDYSQSLSKHISLLQEGQSFCVFPEGRITKDGKLQEGKGGVSFLAHSAPCTIIPVGISGVHSMQAKDFFSFKRKITISFGQPIKPDELYSKIGQPHEAGKSVWREEAAFIMKKIGELIHTSS